MTVAMTNNNSNPTTTRISSELLAVAASHSGITEAKKPTMSSNNNNGATQGVTDGNVTSMTIPSPTIVLPNPSRSMVTDSGASTIVLANGSVLTAVKQRD